VKKYLLIGVSSLGLMALPGVARAQTEPPPHGQGSDRGAFVFGAGVGALFGQPFTGGRLGVSYLVDVQLGYVLPVADRSLGVLLDVGYSEPQASGSGSDPRVGATTPPASAMTVTPGMYSWSLTQRQLITGFTVLYRMTFINHGRIAPYLGIGPRLFFNQSLTMSPPGANMISQTTEQSMTVGLSVPLGLDIALGPGRLFIEALLLWAPIDHRITGDSSVGSVDALVGYRLWL
jgi:hypothetical protein